MIPLDLAIGTLVVGALVLLLCALPDRTALPRVIAEYVPRSRPSVPDVRITIPLPAAYEGLPQPVAALVIEARSTIEDGERAAAASIVRDTTFARRPLAVSIRAPAGSDLERRVAGSCLFRAVGGDCWVWQPN